MSRKFATQSCTPWPWLICTLFLSLSLSLSFTGDVAYVQEIGKSRVKYLMHPMSWEQLEG